jgi:diadenosine tetraphosphatase ApaH/serine/threonine PP2A family protein phosphatase
MWAIASDIHGNFEAFCAVLDDIDRQGVERLILLGDLVGHGGPDPVACLDLARAFGTVFVLGNHDQAVMFDPDGFGVFAEQAIFWTRAQLEHNDGHANARWEFLASLPQTHQEGDVLFVHGSPRNPLNEFVCPEDVYNEQKMLRIFSLIPRYCFGGHTHIASVFTEVKDREPDRWSCAVPSELEKGCYRLDGRKALINVGAVGQPRDGDPRASYVLFDGQAVRFRRVEYDVETTIRKIYAVAELDNLLGDRLREGR